jgi:uncharacterized surface protein with fasciclin (FAS1) repeats
MTGPRHRRLSTASAAALATALAALGSPAASAASPEAAAERPGNRNLVKVLAADGQKLDRNWGDFDIVEAAVLTVLDAKPDSPVGLLAKGKTRLTAFIPTDRAFRHLAKDLTGTAPKSEKKTVQKIMDVADVDTLETVLLYHVVPGATLTSPEVVKAAEATARVRTATGQTLKVRVWHDAIVLVDKDRDDRNPHAVAAALDINRGNKQVAHGIDRVLRPLDR